MAWLPDCSASALRPPASVAPSVCLPLTCIQHFSANSECRKTKSSLNRCWSVMECGDGFVLFFPLCFTFSLAEASGF